MSRWATSIIGACVGASLASAVELPPAPAGVTTFQRYGMEFSVIRASVAQPVPATTGNYGRAFGAGEWDFAMARTELTQLQWRDFVNSFAETPLPMDQPWSQGVLNVLRGMGFSGGSYVTGFSSQGRPIFEVTPQSADLPVSTVGWFAGALYCNWLHNDQRAEFGSLVAGAYNLTNFNWHEPTTWPTAVREPEATFWLPTYDEWAVGAFYDSSRFGPGDGGWWSHLNRRERPGFPGAPGVGETSANWRPADPEDEYLTSLVPVAAYPDSQSPWGLFDTSGSRQEVLDDALEYDRLFAGTASGPISFGAFEYYESIGWVGVEATTLGVSGLRIATVPSPGAVLVVLVCALRSGRRESR